MVDTFEPGEVTRQAFQVEYHNENPDDHSIDVEALAPALLGFGRLIREANAQLNGTTASVRTLVASDFEHKCFHINFEVIQAALQRVKTLLKDDNIQTAKELLQTIGVIKNSGFSNLFGYLSWKRGRKTEVVKAPPERTASGLIVIQIQGDGNTIQIPSDVLKLAENPKVLQAVKETFAPIEFKEANRVEFKENDHPTASYTTDEVRSIIAECDSPNVANEMLVAAVPHAADTIVATLHVYSPVFDAKAKRWRFSLRKKHIYADITETSIAKNAIRRGGSFTNDRYRVRMEVTPPEAPDGEPHYKIIEVLDFTEASQQIAMKLSKPRTRKAAAKVVKKMKKSRKKN